jgi:hypothetical protein
VAAFFSAIISASLYFLFISVSLFPLFFSYSPSFSSTFSPQARMISNSSSLLAPLSLGDPEAEATIHYSRSDSLSVVKSSVKQITENLSVLCI